MRGRIPSRDSKHLLVCVYSISAVCATLHTIRQTRPCIYTHTRAVNMEQVGHNLLYLISRTDGAKMHTFIGSTNDFENRLREHNNTDSATWDPVLILKLPAQREFSTLSLRTMWKRNARGLTSRIRYALKLAKKIHATVFIHDTDTPVLNTLNAYPGEPKQIPDLFWEQF